TTGMSRRACFIQAFAPTLLALIGVASLEWIAFNWSEFAASALWGLLLLLSYVGWGALLNLLLYPQRRLGWGLQAPLGMGLSLAVGGGLAMARLVSSGTVVAWTVLGIVAQGVCSLRGCEPLVLRWRRIFGRHGHSLVFRLAVALFAILIFLQYLRAVGNTSFNTWDDNMAYRGFARQLLDTGTLYEPFSWRRIASYGGQTYLQAMVLSGASPERLHIADNGICLLLVFGLALGYASGITSKLEGAVLMALVLITTLPH